MVGVGHCVNSVGPQGYTQPRAKQVLSRKAREKNKKKIKDPAPLPSHVL